MKIAYLDCASGISGDMLLGALVDAGVDLDAMNRAIDSLGLLGCRLTVEEVRRGGFRAARATVHAEAEQTARHLADILKILGRAELTETQRQRAERVFRRLAEAEAAVHGIDVEQVHFHELGAVDTIVDVVGTVVGFDLLGVERIVASPIPTGSGTVRIAHGTVSVPAPATAELLRGVPLAESSV
ncbi:MAG: LarC family nickel insertion protein, partial [Pirellulaceae bacterium]|nr:LarC family nickel insertion protein [Pirellulaceae bacterium]